MASRKKIKNDNDDRSNLGVIHDPLIRVKPGPNYQNNLPITESSSSSSSKKWTGKELLSIGEIKELWKEIHGAESLKEMEAGPRRKVYLHELLMDSSLLLPKLEIPDRNPVLEKRITALRNSLAEKEYQRMTQNVNCSSHRQLPEDTIGFQMKQMNSALIHVFQFVISIACAFFFGFKGIELFIGEMQLAVRLLLGIGIALTVGAAELYFLAVNFAASEEAFAAASSSSSGDLNTAENKSTIMSPSFSISTKNIIPIDPIKQKTL